MSLRKWRRVLVLSVVALLPLLVFTGLLRSSAVPAAKQPQAGMEQYEQIPGVTVVGDYIEVGVNYMGTLGVGTGIGTGFRFPRGVAYESLAYAFWGHGFLVAYRDTTGADNVAYWYPNMGYPPPPASKLVVLRTPEVVRNDAHKFVMKCFIRTADWRLIIVRHWVFDKHQPSIAVYTTMHNLDKELRDVVFKELVDWDVHQQTYNKWVSYGNEAWASLSTADNRTTMGVIGYPITPHVVVNDVDLYAWDDGAGPYNLRSAGTHVIKSFEPITGDYYAGLYFEIGTMAPNAIVEFKIVFTAGIWYPE